MVMGIEATNKLRRPVAKRWVQKRTRRAGMSIARSRRGAEALGAPRARQQHC
jgi:hypothetical protein